MLCIILSAIISAANAADENKTHIAIVLDKETCSNFKGNVFLRLALSEYDVTDEVVFNLRIKKEFGSGCKISGVVLHGFINKDVLPTLKFAMKLAEYRVRDTEVIPKIHLWLDSEGGLVSEAMKIGDYISTINDLDAIVMNNGKCFSACVLILAAAPIRGGIGDIGIHRPFSYEISTKEMSYNQYLKQYEVVIDMMADYYKKHGVSQALIDAMSITPSDEIKILDRQRLKEWGLGYSNVAKTEYDKAKTIEVCGKEHYELRIKWSEFLRECNAKVADNNCMLLANIAMPGYRSKVVKCEAMKSNK